MGETKVARCKFYCESIEKFSNAQQVHLQTLYDPSIAENEKFCEMTPSGSMEFMVNNPALEGFFVPGLAYYINITAEGIPE